MHLKLQQIVAVIQLRVFMKRFNASFVQYKHRDAVCFLLCVCQNIFNMFTDI